MPRKDAFHDIVINALEFEGWKILNDPLFVPTEGGVNFFIDIGAEHILEAEKEGVQIAIEVKSFNKDSASYSFYEILGQYLVYEEALKEQPIQIPLYIAIASLGYEKLIDAPIFKRMIEKYRLKFIIVEPQTEKIQLWQV